MHGSCIGNSYRRKAYLPGGGSRDPRVLKTLARAKAVRKWEGGKSFGACDRTHGCACRPRLLLGPCDFWAVLQKMGHDFDMGSGLLCGFLRVLFASDIADLGKRWRCAAFWAESACKTAQKLRMGHRARPPCVRMRGCGCRLLALACASLDSAFRWRPSSVTIRRVGFSRSTRCDTSKLFRCDGRTIWTLTS